MTTTESLVGTHRVVRERPIIFSGEMVRAILAGAKTQTRRVVTKGTSTANAKWEHLHWELPVFIDPGLGAGGYLKVPYWVPGDDWDEKRDRVRCRWAIGDRLWVKETFNCFRWDEDGACEILSQVPKVPTSCVVARRATDDDRIKWRPSIYMPRWASRLTLEVLDVQPERLQDISEEDAKAEGVVPLTGFAPDQPVLGDSLRRTQGSHPHTLAFVCLWDDINTDRGYPWASNPWVWKTTFRVIDAPKET